MKNNGTEKQALAIGYLRTSSAANVGEGKDSERRQSGPRRHGRHALAKGRVMERYFEVDGCSIHFDTRGEGDPVVLVQGVGLHGDGWNP